jgi:hypothetical protein
MTDRCDRATDRDPTTPADTEPYEPPTVTILGSIADLTASGVLGPVDGAGGHDELGGSGGI